MAYDAWKTSGPHDECPSHESEQCNRCREPWAWLSDDDERLCEEHADEYLRAEHRRAEGDEIADEERGELAADWSEAS